MLLTKFKCEQRGEGDGEGKEWWHSGDHGPSISPTIIYFSCHSHYLNVQLLRMDYVGITITIITSFFPPVYYIFQHGPHWQLIYFGGITVMGMVTVVTLVAPSFSCGKFQAFRVMLFKFMGFFSYCTCDPCPYCELEQFPAPDHTYIWVGHGIVLHYRYFVLC